jgi:hypothetical protein
LKKARKAATMRWLDSHDAAREAGLAARFTLRQPPPGDPGRLCALLRDLSGNPFRPVVLKPSWLRANCGVVRQMAAAIYEQGHFEDLPVLADALDDAGCAQADLLAHCRGPEEHARGCWAVDLLLGND